MRWANVVSTRLGSMPASAAISSCFVEMVLELDVSAICPSTSSRSSDTPFPPPGPVGSVPRLHRYYGMFRLLAVHRGALGCLRARPTVAVPVVRSVARRHRAPGPGDLYRDARELPLPRVVDGRRRDLPGSPVDPCTCAPSLFDPAGPGVAGRCAAPGTAFRHIDNVGSGLKHYRGSITGLTRALCTLRRAGRPTPTPHSVPAGGQPLPDGTFTRQVHCGRFQTPSFPTSVSFPSPELPGAPTYCSARMRRPDVQHHCSLRPSFAVKHSSDTLLLIGYSGLSCASTSIRACSTRITLIPPSSIT